MQFIDLAAQQARLNDRIDAGIADVLASGRTVREATRGDASQQDLATSGP